MTECVANLAFNSWVLVVVTLAVFLPAFFGFILYKVIRG